VGVAKPLPYTTKLWMIFLAPGNYATSTQVAGYFHNVQGDHCLENLEMSGNLQTVRVLSGNEPCHGKGYQKLVVASCSCHLLRNEVMLKFIFWSLTLTLVIQACYKYHLTWPRVPRIVREMSGNFAVSGELSPWMWRGDISAGAGYPVLWKS